MKICKLFSLITVFTATNAFAFTSRGCVPSAPASISFAPKPRTCLSHRKKQIYMKSLLNDSTEIRQRQSKAMTITKVFDRLTDTMTPAGFESQDTTNPLQRPLMGNFWSGGPKRFFFLLFTMLGIKWFRSKFLLRQKFTDKIPAWGHVITSKEQEDVLHAWTCKECGTTMFIAKGREIRFFNRFVECYNCGAKGKDSFYDRRAEIVEKDDTDFQYENPMDYISNAERRKLEKQKAKEAQLAQATEAEIVATAVAEEVVEEEVSEEDLTAPETVVESVHEAAIVDETSLETREEPIIENKEIKPIVEKADSDDLDVLGMDF